MQVLSHSHGGKKTLILLIPQRADFRKVVSRISVFTRSPSLSPRYRSAEEVDEVRRNRDPISQIEALIIGNNMASTEELRVTNYALSVILKGSLADILETVCLSCAPLHAAD